MNRLGLPTVGLNVPSSLGTRFSIVAFFKKYIYSLPLFPKNGSKSTTRNCAADDLELFVENDEIQLYDNIHQNQAPSYHGPDPISLHKSQLYNPPLYNNPFGQLDGNRTFGLGEFDFPEVTDFSPTSVSSSMNTASLSLSVAPPLQPNVSRDTATHLALNMIGIGMEQYPIFEDFSHSPRHSDASSLYTSTADQMSPLDDMFFKNQFEPTRKRRSEVFPPPVDTAKKQKPDFPLHMSPPKLTQNRHVCPECNASFKVKSYLTRHSKKHNNAKAFMCPFYDAAESDASPVAQSGKSYTRCHPTGGFSRRDTYKTHLKALHFIYPPGTKSLARNSTGGRCAGCFEYFDSNAKWMDTHIESGKCPAISSSQKLQTPFVKQEPFL